MNNLILKTVRIRTLLLITALLASGIFIGKGNITNAQERMHGVGSKPFAPTAQLIVDPTFEAGSPWPGWTTQTSTGFGTPLCNTAGCGTGGGASPPFAGDNWAWFGGVSAAESSTLGQNVVIPSGVTAALTFQMRIGTVNTPFADTLTVSVDGVTQQTYTEPSVAEAAYTLRTINLTPFANGASHAILFTYSHPGTGTSSYTIDDVNVTTTPIGGGAAVTGSKTVTGTPKTGQTLTYSITLTNGGGGAQGDNPGDEFTDVLPAGLTLVSASSTSGTAVATVATRTVTWNGSLAAASGSVTITITATINAGTEGQTLSNQGTISYDGDANGTNEATAVTDNPGTPATNDPTSITVLPAGTFVANPNLLIPDNVYVGGFNNATMACSTIDTTSLPVGTTVGSAQVQIAMSHTWVGDLVIKLQSPNGQILGLLSRPGVVESADDGNDTVGAGDSSNLAIANPLTYVDSAAASAETMGSTPALGTDNVICRDLASPCQYSPAPGAIAQPPANFAGLAGQNARGNWTMCVADAATGDTGTFGSWTLTLAAPTAAGVSVGGRVLTTDGRGVRSTQVTISGPNGYSNTALSGPNGNFVFDDVEAGQTYVVSILSRRFTYQPRVVQVGDNIADLDFTPEQ